MTGDALALPVRSRLVAFRRRQVSVLWNRNRGLTVGGFVLAAWIAVAVMAPLLPGLDPLAQDIAHRFAPPVAGHPFGTDSLGRDVLARVFYGARLTLPTAAIVIVSATLLGSLVGLLSGYRGGVLDDILMRLVESTLAFPSIILAMAIAAALKPSLTNAMVAMVLVWWPEYARLMRGQVLAVRELEHVAAARVLGASSVRIVLRHILPLTLSPLAIKASLDIGNVVLLAAGLSFLGLGSPPPNPEWGAMVSESRTTFSQWWVGTFPALAIVSIVLAANFIGDALRDYLDPRRDA